MARRSVLRRACARALPQAGQRLLTARILNNLGGINFLLGDVATAEANLLAAAETASAAGSDPDLAQAVNSLAHLLLRTGRPLEARVRAERAVELLTGRLDFRDELGNAQLVVAGSLAAEGELALATEWIDDAERTFKSSARRATSRSPGSRAATSSARPVTSRPPPIFTARPQIPYKTSISRR